MHLKISEGGSLVFRLKKIKSKILKPSMAILILFLIFALNVNSTLSNTMKNMKKIF
jgi:hypothetical protein